MNPSRVFILIAVGCSLLCSRPLMAQGTGAPFDVSKQYSAEMTITSKDGEVLTQKIYSDNGKMRSEMTTGGMNMVSIVRPDLKKIYSVMPSQKAVMEMPYDPATQPMPGSATANDGKFEVVGTETAEGVSCTKYKMTTKDGKVAFFWVDTDKKALVKMVPDDGSATIVWKNFVAGPQDAALFNPPADYKLMQMPSAPAMPGQ